MPTFLVAHATRRPKKALEVRAQWLAMARFPDDVAWVFGIDDDDEESKRILANEPHVIVKAGGGSVPAFNAAAASGPAEIYIAGADDTFAPRDWDQQLVRRLEDTSKPAALLTGDGRRMDRLATCPIVTRGWVEKFGWLFPPEFRTMGPDSWISERASRDGCYIDALDLVFEHRHPYYGHGEVDEVYKKHNEPEGWVHTREVFFRMLEKLPISLCMIVGNEEDKILRCLESAKDAFDELCIVRACGDVARDDTVRLAAEWCEANEKRFASGMYENRRDGRISHLDDFSAARNLSFDMAQNYWQLWLDADEVLTPQACTGIRECAHNTRFDCHSFRRINPDGSEYYRERLIKRGKGKWEGKVFEVCKVDGFTARVKEVEIHHEPGPVKDPGRNLRILETIPDKDKTPREWFYYHEELFRNGRLEEARHAGDKALMELPEGSTEQYEALLNMADLLPDKDALQELEVAVHLQPYRREALAALCQRHLANRNIAEATAYFRMMDSLPVPRPKPCGHRPAWYKGGWAQRDLRWQIMRVNGLHKDAYDEEKVWYGKQEEPVTLAIVCPIEKSEEGIIARSRWLQGAKRPEAVQVLIVGGNILEWNEFAVVRDVWQLKEIAIGRCVIVDQDLMPKEGWDVDKTPTFDETRSRSGADRVAAAAT